MQVGNTLLRAPSRDVGDSIVLARVAQQERRGMQPRRCNLRDPCRRTGAIAQLGEHSACTREMAVRLRLVPLDRMLCGTTLMVQLHLGPLLRPDSLTGKGIVSRPPCRSFAPKESAAIHLLGMEEMAGSIPARGSGRMLGRDYIGSIPVSATILWRSAFWGVLISATPCRPLRASFKGRTPGFQPGDAGSSPAVRTSQRLPVSCV
jgi:hypothetical protein